MGSITRRIVAMAEAEGIDVHLNGRLRGVSPDTDWDYARGPYGAEVTTFDASDLATLIRIVYRGGDHLPTVMNAYGVRPSHITAEEIHRLAGGEYRARVVAEVDDMPHEEFGPYAGGPVSMATFSAGRDYIGGGTWEYGGVRVDAEGAALTADKVVEIHDRNAPWRSGIYAAYRALTYSGARGIHTVGSFSGSQSHLAYVHHTGGSPEHWLGYSDALAWVPAEVIAEHCPAGPLDYSPATGWVDGNGLSVEAEVERWCADLVDGELSVMDDLVRGNVYHLTVEHAVVTEADGADDPDWDHLDSCGGYIGDDADPTVFTSGAFHLLVEAVVSGLAARAEELAAEREAAAEELAAEREAAAEAAALAAAHAEWRAGMDPDVVALVERALGESTLSGLACDADLDKVLDQRGLELSTGTTGKPAIVTYEQ